MLKKHIINHPVLLQQVVIIRGADIDRFDLAPQDARRWANSAGLSYNIVNDNEMLSMGVKIYDALYSWAKHVQVEKHM